MDRSYRVNGNRRLKNHTTFIRAFFVSISLLLLMGFKFGASYIYAESSVTNNNSINDSTLPKLFSISQSVTTSVFSPKVVDIITSDNVTRHLVYGKTVSEIIDETGYTLNENDITFPDLPEVIAHNGKIQIIRVQIEYIEKEETIPFMIIEKNTDSLNTGTVKIEQEGKNGLLAKVIKIVYQDGVATRSSIVKTYVKTPVVHKNVLIGTKPVTIQSCGYWDNVIDRYVDPAKNAKKNDWMKFVMRCETWCDSGQNTRNVYFGLYQFNKRTFASKGGVNIFDGTEQIRIVSGMYDFGDPYRSLQWPSCNAKYKSL